MHHANILEEFLEPSLVEIRLVEKPNEVAMVYFEMTSVVKAR